MRLIDADELLTHRFVGVVGEAEKLSYMVGWNTAIEAVVENAPTIDAVPVVRCRECLYWHENGEESYCSNLSIDTGADFFCSYGHGQRREDGDA